MLGPEHRLATYGTLSPGEVNHHQLDGLVGTWRQGTVRGIRHASGWGTALGFPALVLDTAGPEVPVHVFESVDLPAHWPRLDAFEGEGYVRTVIEVSTSSGPLLAQLYCAA